MMEAICCYNDVRCQQLWAMCRPYEVAKGFKNSGYGHGCLPGERGQLSGPPKQVSSSRVLTDVPHSSKFPMYSISRRGRVLTLRTRGPGTTPASARTPSVPGKASQFGSTDSQGLEDPGRQTGRS